MLNGIIKELKIFIRNNSAKLLLCLAICLFGFILGIFLSNKDEVTQIFSSKVINFYVIILDADYSPIKFLFTRFINLIFLLLLIFLLSTNKITIYFIPFLIFYRAYILAISLRFFILNLGINGIMIFIFSTFLQNVLLTLAIIIFFIRILEINCVCTKKLINNSVNILIKIAIIALVGIILEFILVNFIFRPLNLYF